MAPLLRDHRPRGIHAQKLTIGLSQLTSMLLYPMSVGVCYRPFPKDTT